MAWICRVHADTTALVVEFSDRSRIPMQLRDVPYVVLPEADSSADVLKMLEPAALRGDPQKAYAMFSVIDICRRTTASEAKQFLACKSLNPADLESADRWLTKSADAGFVLALVELARRADHGSDETQVLAAYQRLWEAGNFYALPTLARLAKARDPILSASYEMLYLQIHQALADVFKGPTAKMIADQTRKALSPELDALDPADRDRVVMRAKELLAANTNCCFRF